MKQEGIATVSVRFCRIENVPTDLSQTYNATLAAKGQREADKNTYWSVIPMPSIRSPEKVE